MCRTEFNPNPTVSDLTRELQVLVPRWRRDFASREPGRFLERDRDRPRRSQLSRHVAAPTLDRHSPADQVMTPVPPPPLSTSYDRSKIGLQPHPLTKKLTRCYTKPNGSIIFMNRNCSRCHEAHFDFEHDSIRAPAPAAHLVLDNDRYEMWEHLSDTADEDDSLVNKKLN